MCTACHEKLSAIVRTKLTSANSASQISRLPMYRTAQTTLIFWMVFSIFSASAALTNEVQTTAAEIRSLTAEQASRAIPVSITGIVTVAQPGWGGSFFVQDPSGGIFVFK